MSALFILCACVLVTAPTEAVRERKRRQTVKPYRKPDPPKRHKKSPSTVQSSELLRLYPF